MRAFALAVLVALIGATAQGGPREACAYSTQMQGVSCLVMVSGRIAHEAYDGAGAADRPWGLASGTKSFSGVAAAAAVQDGLFRLDDPVADTLTEWQADARRTVTIRQLLQLVSGIRTPGPREQLRLGYAESVALPLNHPPGSQFAYGQAPFQIFAALMERRLGGESYHAYMQRRFLGALGITLKMRQPLLGGDPSWGGGGQMTARDWAVFGEFVRLGGVWGGRQLVDPDALSQNFQGSAAHPGYGLTWWLKPPRGAQVPRVGTTQTATDFYRGGGAELPIERIWMAAGAGKQRLYILPDRQIVAVRQTARMLRGEKVPYSDLEFLRLLLD